MLFGRNQSRQRVQYVLVTKLLMGTSSIPLPFRKTGAGLNMPPHVVWMFPAALPDPEHVNLTPFQNRTREGIVISLSLVCRNDKNRRMPPLHTFTASRCLTCGVFLRRKRCWKLTESNEADVATPRLYSSAG